MSRTAFATFVVLQAGCLGYAGDDSDEASATGRFAIFRATDPAHIAALERKPVEAEEWTRVYLRLVDQEDSTDDDVDQINTAIFHSSGMCGARPRETAILMAATYLKYRSILSRTLASCVPPQEPVVPVFGHAETAIGSLGQLAQFATRGKPFTLARCAEIMDDFATQQANATKC